ncbi:MAG: hypothetical protein HY074_05850, partial [Deltaproteobacteria bacterium]|nr:hypothetical protein [Deltaproteobacteria bacterium]
QAVAFTQSKDYAARVPALLFGLANFILGAIFLGLWAISPERPEYFFVSLYALVTSVLSFLLVDTLIVALTPLGSARAYMTLMIFKATAAILLSLAFARVRTLLSWLVIAAAALATAGLLHFHNPLELILFSYGQIQWIIPLAALLGSLVCMHQALYLAKSDKPRTWHPKRIKRLSLFSLSFGVTFLVASIAILLEPVTAKWNHYYRVSDLLLIYVVAAIVFSEYRDRERQLAAAPGSEYHKRPVLPEQVIGAILTVDLKNSEPLYKMRAESSSDQHPVVQWRTHMNAAILRCSGTIIRNKGDEISVLFDQSKTRNPAATAMNAALEIFHASSRLEDEFRLQGLLPPGVAGLRCRISVVEGALRPIFEKYGNTLEPQWEESGSSTPLLTTARLLEMEKAVSSPEQSALIMTEALATASEAAFSPLAALKFTRTRTCRDKHGQRHELAVMSYQQLTGGESLAA